MMMVDTMMTAPPSPAIAPPHDTTLRFLDVDGTLLPDGPYAGYLSRLSVDDLRTLFRNMVLTRRFDTEATALQRQGELGLWAPCLGQEAAQVGSAYALRPQDFAFPGYRDHGVLFTRGVDLTQTLAHTRGTDHGGWDPREHNCQIYTLVVGAQTLHATGYAMGVAKDGACATGNPDTDEAVIVYFGDGATAEGDVSEALVFAGVMKAPLVFFCQNNHWAISQPNQRESAVALYRRGEGFGVPGIQVDGNDVLACYAATAAALDAARSGKGPRLIEAVTYRMGAHTTSDDPTRYRDAAETAAWAKRDPITRLRRFLELQQLGDPAFFAAVDQQAEALAQRTRSVARSLEPQSFERYFDHVYADPHPLIEEERADWLAHKQLHSPHLGGAR